MSRFLNLIEEYDPTNNEDPKWALIDFLKSKGIKVSLVRDTDMLYIDTGSQTIVVTVSNNEEDAESIEAGFGKYEVGKEVEGLADKAASGLKGIGAKIIGTSAQKAKSAVNKRQQMAQKAVDVYDKDTKRLEKSLQNYNKTGTVRPTV